MFIHDNTKIYNKHQFSNSIFMVSGFRVSMDIVVNLVLIVSTEMVSFNTNIPYLDWKIKNKINWMKWCKPSSRSWLRCRGRRIIYVYLVASATILELRGLIALMRSEEIVDFSLFDVVGEARDEEGLHLLCRRRHLALCHVCICHICMNTYIYTYTYTYVCVCVYIHMHIRMDECKCISYTYIYAYQISIEMYECICKAYMYINLCTYMYTYINLYVTYTWNCRHCSFEQVWHAELEAMKGKLLFESAKP